jgi:hypothetical protein
VSFFIVRRAPDYGKAKDAAKQIFDLLARKPLMDNGSTDGDEIVSYHSFPINAS